MLDHIHAERLLQVVRVLEELPSNKHFSLTHWQCNSAACAIGYAGQDPWFKRRGFKMIGEGRYKEPCYRGYDDPDQSVRFFFDITPWQMRYLFFKSYYRRGQKRDVIHRIKQFVKKPPTDLEEEMLRRKYDR